MNILNYLLIIICLLLSLVSNSFACSDTYPCRSSDGSCSLSQARAACDMAKSDKCYLGGSCSIQVIQCSQKTDGTAVADVGFQLCDFESGRDWPCFGTYSPFTFWTRLYGADAEPQPFDCSSSNVPETNDNSSSSTCNLDTASSTKWISTPPNAGGGGTKTCSDSCLYIASGACYTDGRCEYRLGNPVTDSADFATCASYSSVTNNNNTTVNVDLSGVESRLDSSNTSLTSLNGGVDKLNTGVNQLNSNLNKFFNPDTSELPAKSTELQTEVTTSLTTSTTSQAALDSSLSDLNGDKKMLQSDLFNKFKTQLLLPFSSSFICPIVKDYVVDVSFFGSDLTLHFDLSMLCLWFSMIRFFILIGFFFKALRIAFL